MSKPDVTLNVSPTSGFADLVVSASYSDVVIPEYIDPISIAHLGYLQETEVANPFHIAHLGYYISDGEYATYWDFGDGIIELDVSTTHTYTIPGHYVLKLVLLTGGETYYYPVDIYVKSSTYGNDPESFTNVSDGDRYCLHFGSNEKEGLGWSVFGNDSWVWPDTRGSVFDFFEAEDQVFLVYDSITGLPYVVDVRKDTGFLDEVFDDKVDPLVANSGIFVNSRFVTEQMQASSERFSIRPSDLSIFMEGMNKSSFLAQFQADLSLIVDGADISKIYAIAFDRELYFKDGKNKEGHVHQFKFEQNRSGYLLRKILYSLIIYDKALYPHLGSTTIEDAQANFGNVIAWATRYDYSIDRVDYQNIFLPTGFDKIDGPDGQTDSGLDVTAGEWQNYAIVVTDFFTEDLTDNICFISDTGTNPNATMSIKDFQVWIDDSLVETVDFSAPIRATAPWGSEDSGTATPNSNEITFTGKCYKEIDYPVDCNGPKVEIIFKFKSSSEGLYHCIGLADDVVGAVYPANRMFQIFGYGTFGYQNYNNYYLAMRKLLLLPHWYANSIDFYIWSTNPAPFYSEVNEILYSFVQGVNTWYLVRVLDVQTPSDARLFFALYYDFRIVANGQISASDIKYYYEDIENNSGDSFLP